MFLKYRSKTGHEKVIVNETCVVLSVEFINYSHDNTYQFSFFKCALIDLSFNTLTEHPSIVFNGENLRFLFKSI